MDYVCEFSRSFILWHSLCVQCNNAGIVFLIHSIEDNILRLEDSLNLLVESLKENCIHITNWEISAKGKSSHLINQMLLLGVDLSCDLLW